ncbi:hypothetical protein, partial [Kitasatospora griseola]|uniref:hypothetical protein n=1 Tax=Kitasatospora griseola TaxID=2064 RepID=UPI001E4D6895
DAAAKAGVTGVLFTVAGTDENAGVAADARRPTHTPLNFPDTANLRVNTALAVRPARRVLDARLGLSTLIEEMPFDRASHVDRTELTRTAAGQTDPQVRPPPAQLPAVAVRWQDPTRWPQCCADRRVRSGAGGPRRHREAAGERQEDTPDGEPRPA